MGGKCSNSRGMKLRARLLAPLASLATLALLAGCGTKDDATVDIDVIGAPDDPFESGLRLSLAGQLVRAATSEGLVSFDEQGRVIPALADRWIVTDDGMTYIFRLRDGTWSDGSALTGESASDALRQALFQLKGTPLGESLNGIADLRAMTGRVVEVRLSHPMPDLLDLLAQPELALLHRGRGTGPLESSRKGKGVLLRLVDPVKLGLAPGGEGGNPPELHALRITAIPSEAALTRFRDGKSAALLGGTATDYNLGLAASGLSHRAFRADQVSGLFGLMINGTSGPLATPEMREALAMAIDREALTAALAISDWIPTSRIIPATTPDAAVSIGERWTNLDMAQRRDEAVSRLAHLKTKGGKRPLLHIAMPPGPGADAIYARLKADFAAIGLDSQRVNQAAAAELRLVDLVPRYSRADWFFDLFACSTGRDPCSPVADRAAQNARAERDPAKRAKLLEDAEAALTLANVFIPLGQPVRWSLVRGDLPGFAPNPRGWHPFSPIARSGK